MNHSSDKHLLGSEDPAPVRVIRRPSSTWLIYCEHASALIPVALGTLGLQEEISKTHIGWDIGAQTIAEHLSEKLDCTLVLARYSRLVIDCNRYLDDPACIPAISAGYRIPGNENLDAAARDARISEIYLPYHEALFRERERLMLAGAVPVMLAIHSCTDVWKGEKRPWEIGISWRADDRVAKPLLDALQAVPRLVVGDNLPYDIDPAEDFTTPEHAMRHGLAHVQVEFRQDLIATREAAHHWADVFLGALIQCMPQPDWHRREPQRAPPLRDAASELTLRGLLKARSNGLKVGVDA